MSTLRIPRGSSPSLRVTIYEGDQSGPVLDLSGLPVAVVDSNLPIVPVIAVTDAIQGVCTLTFPDTTPMPLLKSHKMRVRVGAPGDPGTFTTPFFEVMAI